MIRDWAALLFAMVFPSVMSWVCFVGLATQNGRSYDTALLVYVYFTGKTVQFSFPAVYTWLFYREDLRPQGPNLRGMVPAVGFALFTVAVMFAVYLGLLRGTAITEVASRAIIGKLREFHIATPAGFVLFAVFVSVIHSLAEEYYFRWFIFRLLEHRLKLTAAVIVSALSFMAHHIVTLAVYFPGDGSFLVLVVLFSIAVAVGGAVWALVYHFSGSLYAPWVSHVIIDAGIMVVGYDLVAPYLSS